MSQPPDWSESRDPSGFGQPPPESGGASPAGQYSSPPAGQYGQPYQQTPGTAGPPPDAYAGFWIRFLGALVDGILLSIVGAILSFLPNPQIYGPYSLLSLVIAGAYFGYLHSTRAGQTVGQRLCGIRLVNAADAGQVAPGPALLRWAMSYVSGIPFLLGYLWMLWDPQKQTWHDKVASTYVVKASHYPPAAPFGQR